MNLLKIIYLNVFHQTAEAASFGVVQILTAYAYVRTIGFFHVVERPNLSILWIQGSAVASETYVLLYIYVNVSFMDSLLQLTMKTVVVGSS